MRKGFSLIELMIVLLLTGILLSSLFLFTFYFWKNHLDQMQYLQFTDQKQVFLEWVHKQIRNSVELRVKDGSVTLKKTDGTEVDIRFTTDGPQYDGILFFNQPTETSCTMEHDLETDYLKFTFKQGRWTHIEEVWAQCSKSPALFKEGES